MNRGFLSMVLAVLAFVLLSITVLSNQTFSNTTTPESAENIPSSNVLVWAIIDQRVANFFANQSAMPCSASDDYALSISPDFSILDDRISCQLTLPGSIENDVEFMVGYTCESGSHAYRFKGKVYEKYSWSESSPPGNCLFNDEYQK